MKFIHTADLHLDSPMRGLERYEGAPTEALRQATRRALQNLVDFALREAVQLVVIAGDIYDVDWKDYNTGQFFNQQMTRLVKENIPVVMVRGNHDAKNVITRSLRLPEKVYDLSTKEAETIKFEALGIVVHGRGYHEREVKIDLASSYPDAEPGMFNIGILHTALNGRPPHGEYAPCTLDTLLNKGYDYWALGHVHQREIVHENPWIVFPGNLQGRNVREAGAKGATIVTVTDGHVSQVSHQDFDVVRWAICTVDLQATNHIDGALNQLIEQLELIADSAQQKLVAVRLILTGETDIHDSLMKDMERCIHDIRAAVSEKCDTIWLEKVMINTQPRTDIAALRKRDDAIGSLLREMAILSDQPARMEEFMPAFYALDRKLPNEYYELPDALNLTDPVALADLVKEVERYLLTKLRQDNS